MLRDSTYHRSGSFWTQAETAIALHMTAAKQGLEVFARDRGKHLFRNHIGCLADAAYEKLGLLEDGRLDRLVTITREHRRSATLEMIPYTCLLGKQVSRTFRGLKCHREPACLTEVRDHEIAHSLRAYDLVGRGLIVGDIAGTPAFIEHRIHR